MHRLRTLSDSDTHFLETSAHTLAFAILLMALHPNVQAKIREESLRVWPTLNDVQTSTYKRDFNKFVSSSLSSYCSTSFVVIAF